MAFGDTLLCPFGTRIYLHLYVLIVVSLAIDELFYFPIKFIKYFYNNYNNYYLDVRPHSVINILLPS